MQYLQYLQRFSHIAQDIKEIRRREETLLSNTIAKEIRKQASRQKVGNKNYR